MTVWAEGSGRYSDESKYRTIPVREFVRRFRHSVTRQETAYTWLMGAGCSVSSGIPTAAEAARGWIKELKYLETGHDGDIDGWAAKRFVGYKPDDPGSVYAEALQALFYTDHDKRREIERMMASAEPGFGYATLAQLMTHEKWGSRCAMALSTNFDDLAADALHLFSQKRPQVFTAQSLDRHVALAPGAPTLVKIYGDAHLPGGPSDRNRPQLPAEAKDRLRGGLADTGLIIVGYGGRDECVMDLLEALPADAPIGGVYWVNAVPPTGAMAEWLESRSAIWVNHADFDELMYLVRLEFGLGHPKIERFERMLRRYDSQYKAMSNQSGMNLTETPEEEEPLGKNLELNAPTTITARRQTADSRRERLRQSLSAVSNVIAGAVGPEANTSDSGAAAQTDVPDEGLPLSEDMIAAAGPAVSGQEPSTEASGHSSTSAPQGQAESDQELLDFASAPSMPGEGVSEATKQSLFDAAKLELGDKKTADRAVPAPSDGALGVASEASATEDETAKGQSADKQTLREKSADEAPAGQVDATTRGTAGDPSAEAENVSPIYAADPDGESEAPRADIEPGVHGLSPSALARLLGADLREMNGTADGVGSDSAETTPASDAPVTVDDALSQMAEEGELAIPDPKDLPEPADSAVQAATTPRLTAAEERDRLQRVTVGSGGLPPLLPPEPRTELTAAEVERGRAAFDVAIAEAPRDGELRARYARFLAVALGDYGSAQEQFEEAELLLPKNVDILCDYATFALKALADGDLAEKLLSQAFHLDERSPTVLRALADFLLRARGEVDEAENCLRLAVDINPKDSESRIAYARFLLDRRGRREVAEGLFRKAAEIDDKNGAVLAELALFQAETAQTVDRAAQQIDRAAELSPHHPMVLFAQAVIAERKGELDEAESSLLRAVKADPQHQRAQLALAKFLTSRRRDLERAKGQFEDALKALPLEAEVYTAYAIFCERQLDDTDTAEGLHRDAIRLEPNNPLVLAAFAEFLGRHSEFVDEAERLFSDALAQAPRSPAILRAFGTFLAERGDADKAEKYLRRAVEFDPNGAEAFDDLATFLANIRKDADEAEIYFREALRLAPDRTETLTKFAAFLRESKGDLDEAEAQFRKAVQRNPKDAATLSRTAQFLLAQGHRAEGLKILNEAFDAAYSLDLEVRPSWLMLELWICRFAHDPARQAESARAAKGLLASGVRSEGWDYRLVVETAIEVGHSDAQQLRSLALVAVDDAEEDLLSA